MKWFRKQTAPAGASVQLRETGHHPFGLLGQYVPMRSGEIRLYRAVDRKKEFEGILTAYDDQSVTIEQEDGTEASFERAAIALIRLAFDF